MRVRWGGGGVGLGGGRVKWGEGWVKVGVGLGWGLG